MRSVIVLLVACGDGPGGTIGGSIRGEPTLETFEHRMCACRDRSCTKQVVQDMAAWSNRIRAPRGNVDDTANIMARYNACMTEANR